LRLAHRAILSNSPHFLRCVLEFGAALRYKRVGGMEAAHRAGFSFQESSNSSEGARDGRFAYHS
jgi:hypothetical protein